MAEKSADIVVAKFDYHATDSHELGMRKGERLILLEDSSTWLRVMNSQGATGYVPCNYVKRYKQGFFYTLRHTLSRRRSKRDGLQDDGLSKNPSPGPNDNGLEVQRTRHGSFESFADQLEQLKLSPADVFPAGSLTRDQNPTPHSFRPANAFADSFPPVTSTDRPSDKSHYSIPEGVNSKGHSTILPQGASSSASNGFMQVRQNGHSGILSVSQQPSSSASDQNSYFDTGSSGIGRHMCQALFAYQARQMDELTIHRGDKIHVLEKSPDGWWRGTLVKDNGTSTGWFPSNYVTLDVTKNLNRAGSTSQPNNLNTVSMDNGTTMTPNQTQSQTLNYDSARTRMMMMIPQPYSSTRSGHHPGTSRSPPIGRELVRTLYPFVKSQMEELSFEAGELLEVIDKPPDDPDWWRCRNTLGATGLVPRNYICLVPDSLSAPGPVSPPDRVNRPSDDLDRSCGHAQTPGPAQSSHPSQSRKAAAAPGASVRYEYAIRSIASKAHADQPWCWGSISRVECESLLGQYAKPGEFIIRDSESHPGGLTITIQAGNKTRNFKVRVERGQYLIGQKVFPNVQDLIEHYRCHPIFKNDQEKHYLTRPFVHPADAADCKRVGDRAAPPAGDHGGKSSVELPPIHYS